MVGEWTKVPDRDIATMEDDCAKKGLPVRIRNAEPYREFQNFEDNDRYPSVNLSTMIIPLWCAGITA